MSASLAIMKEKIFNPGMSDLRETRKINARYLLKYKANNNQSMFARDCGFKNPSYVNHIIGPNAFKPIGDKSARKIERAYGMDAYWLDKSHSELEVGLISTKGMSILISALRHHDDINLNLLGEVTETVLDVIRKEKLTLPAEKENLIISHYYTECEYNKSQPTPDRAKQIISLNA